MNLKNLNSVQETRGGIIKTKKQYHGHSYRYKKTLRNDFDKERELERRNLVVRAQGRWSNKVPIVELRAMLAESDLPENQMATVLEQVSIMKEEQMIPLLDPEAFKEWLTIII